MTRSWAYNRFGVLMGTSWRASGPRWPSLRGDIWPMITLFLSQGDFCATARNPSHASEVESHEIIVALESKCQSVEARWGMEVDLNDPMATDGGKALTYNRMEAKPIAGEHCRFCGRERV